MSKDWHSGHFCCWQCDESLTGQRYVLRDEHPYCIKCYESVFANGCEECNKIIGIDSKVRYTSSLFSKCPFLFFFFLLNFLSYVVSLTRSMEIDLSRDDDDDDDDSWIWIRSKRGQKTNLVFP